MESTADLSLKNTHDLFIAFDIFKSEYVDFIPFFSVSLKQERLGVAGVKAYSK